LKHLVLLWLAAFGCFWLYADNQSDKIDSLTQLIGQQSGRERIETLIQLSEIYRKISVDKSKEADSNAVAYANQEGLDSMKGIILLSMGKTASISGDYELALDYMNQAATLLKEANNNTELARTYVNMGLVYKNLADYSTSIKHFDLASDIATTHDLKDQEAAAAANRATVYFALGDYQKALIELNLSLELGRKTNKLYAEIEALLEIGRTYVDLEDYRTALIYFKQIDNSLSDRLDTRLLYIKGTVLAYTVYLNKELGSSENLLLLAEKAINIFSALGADEDIKKLREILWV